MGAGRTVRCEISKTKEGYQLAVTSASALKEELAELNKLNITIQQQTGNNLKAETSRKPTNLLKTLTQNTAGDLPPAKRARTTRGSVPVVNVN